ncbi:MAG: response regulator [Myxococcales bacterium]|nr:response regulator [Myxococcales bacterium]
MASGLKVLIVDDRADGAGLGDLIMGAGHVPVVAAGRAHALALAADVDVVILDLRAAGTDGLEVLGLLVASGRPVMVIAARTDQALRTAALDRGAVDLLAAPVDPLELGARLRLLGARARRPRSWRPMTAAATCASCSSTA